ncbi:MAG: copper amine oxidase N-terminal domain-containing protein [Clostridiales bacterium]|nr:copper amine oxidase N-terminal domain-containing protein [Clostridiales bacterium]
MKKIMNFASGALAATIVLLASMSALAASGAITIEASPINVLVNGAVFEPKDPNGNPALVFVYNGTTYAPLRALSEAYGLEVGYDSTKNLATVSQPKTANAPQKGATPAATPPGAAPTGNAPEQNYGGSEMQENENNERPLVNDVSAILKDVTFFTRDSLIEDGILYKGKEYYTLLSISRLYDDISIEFNQNNGAITFGEANKPFTVTADDPHVLYYQSRFLIEHDWLLETIIPSVSNTTRN